MHYFDEIINDLKRYEHLGTRTLSNGTRLIGQKPLPGLPGIGPPYYHKIFARLNENEIDLLEIEIQRPLPSFLKRFYILANGLNIFSGALSVQGLRYSYKRTGEDIWQPISLQTPNVMERPKDADDDFVFFGFYDWDGSQLYATTRNSAVYMCARYQSKRVLMEWPSFEEMLVSEVRRLNTLFDDSGQKVDENVPTIPQWD